MWCVHIMVCNNIYPNKNLVELVLNNSSSIYN